MTEENRKQLMQSLIGKRVNGVQYFGISDYYRLLFEDGTEIPFRLYGDSIVIPAATSGKEPT